MHVNIAHLYELVSLFIVPNTAAHGVYNKVITIKDTAVKGVNTPCIASYKFCSFFYTSIYHSKVATTASLAAIPANNPTAACHVPNPAGLNIGAINSTNFS